MLQEQLELLGLTGNFTVARCEMDMNVKDKSDWETGQDVIS